MEFIKGNIESLPTLNLDTTFDIVISNCVINLCKNKINVNDVFTLLKYGGEFYFGDVYSSQRIHRTLISRPVLWGECLSGALYWE